MYSSNYYSFLNVHVPEECHILCCQVHSKMRVIFVAIEILIFASKKKRVLLTYYLLSAKEFSQDGVKIGKSNHETLTETTFDNREINVL